MRVPNTLSIVRCRESRRRIYSSIFYYSFFTLRFISEGRRVPYIIVGMEFYGRITNASLRVLLDVSNEKKKTKVSRDASGSRDQGEHVITAKPQWRAHRRTLTPSYQLFQGCLEF